MSKCPTNAPLGALRGIVAGSTYCVFTALHEDQGLSDREKRWFSDGPMTMRML